MAAEVSAAAGPHAPTAPTKHPRKRRLLPAALRGPDAAGFCGIAYSSWSRFDAAGLIPAGAMVSGCKVWGRRELARWIDFGCPDRKTWTPLWENLRKN